jgi:hypothetical protein
LTFENQDGHNPKPSDRMIGALSKTPKQEGFPQIEFLLFPQLQENK